MNLTKHAILSIGYEEHSEDDELEILFGTYRIFSFKGITLKSEPDNPTAEIIKIDENCSVAFSNSINAASAALTDDVFTDEDEKKWIDERKISPPFAVVYFKESETRLLKGGYRKIQNNDIYLYDGFPDGKHEIRNWEKDQLPCIVTSLTAQLSKTEGYIEFLPVYKVVFGTTTEGKTVFDHKMTVSASGSVYMSREIDQISPLIKDAVSMLPKIKGSEVRHLHAALNEQDKLKQFLSFFLFIERFTNRCFKTCS